jgi:hypothetical protein
MKPEKTGVPRVPGVPAFIHAGLRWNTSKTARVPCVPRRAGFVHFYRRGNTWNTWPKSGVPSANPHGHWLEHREHMGTSDLEVGFAQICKKAAVRTSPLAMQSTPRGEVRHAD